MRGQIVTAMIFNPILSGQQLLRAIATDFGIKTGRDRFTILEALNHFLLNQASRGANVVLFIDEAQNIPANTMEQVRLLSNLETTKQKLLQIVLAGQPELKDRLADPNLRQLRQRITVRYHIPPLAATDIDGYVHHRLRTAGAPEDVIFDAEAIDSVAKYSSGIPRMINAVCDYALLAGFTLKKRQINLECLKMAINELENNS
jgi:general secretion pathway protein A